MTYPLWPSRTFTRCKGHSSDLDNNSFRHEASLDADGHLRRRFVRDGEKISLVWGTESGGVSRIVSAMIVSGEAQVGIAIVPFRLPFSHDVLGSGKSGRLPSSQRVCGPQCQRTVLNLSSRSCIWPAHLPSQIFALWIVSCRRSNSNRSRVFCIRPREVTGDPKLECFRSCT